MSNLIAILAVVLNPIETADLLVDLFPTLRKITATDTMATLEDTNGIRINLYQCHQEMSTNASGVLCVGYKSIGLAIDDPEAFRERLREKEIPFTEDDSYGTIVFSFLLNHSLPVDAIVATSSNEKEWAMV